MGAGLRKERSLRRNPAQRPAYDRILIVCEGSKTEPNYFQEIRIADHISAAHIRVLPSELGTEPMQVVASALAEFKKTREFERIYAVFDRDQHHTYAQALMRAAQLSGRLRNSERKSVVFKAIPSVPCFELWLLLHFQDVLAFNDRHEPIQHLKRHIPGYDKGQTSTYALTRNGLEDARGRAARLRQQFNAHTGRDPYTDVDALVDVLRALRTP